MNSLIPRLSRNARRLLLTLHVITSVGWLGLAAALVVLAGTALHTPDQVVRSGSYSMMLIFDLVTVPIGLAALLTGLVLGWGTHWGVLRHWWVLVKLIANIAVLIIPLLARRPAVLDSLDAARAGLPPGSGAVRVVAASIAALIVLIAATVLSTYKPWGRIRPAIVLSRANHDRVNFR